MSICTNCSCNPCCCPQPLPVPAPPVVSVESNPAALPDCPSCPPVIHEELYDFVIPEDQESTFVNVCDTDAWPVGMCVHITDGNSSAVMRIVSVNDADGTIELRNEELEQTDPSGTVMTGTIIMILSGLCPDSEAAECWLLGVRTAAAITLPDEGSTAQITLNTCVFLKAGQTLYIEGFGCVVVDVVSESNPFAVFNGLFNNLYGMSPGETIAGGAYVTTAEKCETPFGYLNSGSNGTLWALNDEVGVDPNLSVSVNVNAGDKVEIKGNCQMLSPRGSLKFNVTGTAGATKTLGLSLEYEDGFNDGPGIGVVDVNPYMTAHHTEIWEAQTDGTIVAKWEGVVGTSGNNPAFNSHKRTIIISRV